MVILRWTWHVGRRRPVRGKPTVCPHGPPAWCNRVHIPEDPRLGEPLCSDCYDYEGHAALNWWAPELWRRFTITLRRLLAAAPGSPTPISAAAAGSPSSR